LTAASLRPTPAGRATAPKLPALIEGGLPGVPAPVPGFAAVSRPAGRREYLPV